MPDDLEEERLQISGDVSLLPESKLTYARQEFEVSNGRVDFVASILWKQCHGNRTSSSAGWCLVGSQLEIDTGGAGVRLEEVVLSAKLVCPRLKPNPNLTSNCE